MPQLSIATMIYSFGPSHGQPESLRRREATLTIRGSAFRYDELREIWRRLRRQGITEKKPLQQRHADVWKFVEKGRADGKTWQQVLDEWNADPGRHYYYSIRGLQRAKRRAEEKGLMAGDFFESVDEDEQEPLAGDQPRPFAPTSTSTSSAGRRSSSWAVTSAASAARPFATRRRTRTPRRRRTASGDRSSRSWTPAPTSSRTTCSGASCSSRG